VAAIGVCARFWSRVSIINPMKTLDDCEDRCSVCTDTRATLGNGNDFCLGQFTNYFHGRRIAAPKADYGAAIPRRQSRSSVKRGSTQCVMCNKTLSVPVSRINFSEPACPPSQGGTRGTGKLHCHITALLIEKGC